MHSTLIPYTIGLKLCSSCSLNEMSHLKVKSFIFPNYCYLFLSAFVFTKYYTKYGSYKLMKRVVFEGLAFCILLEMPHHIHTLHTYVLGTAGHVTLLSTYLLKGFVNYFASHLWSTNCIPSVWSSALSCTNIEIQAPKAVWYQTNNVLWNSFKNVMFMRELLIKSKRF